MPLIWEARSSNRSFRLQSNAPWHDGSLLHAGGPGWGWRSYRICLSIIARLVTSQPFGDLSHKSKYNEEPMRGVQAFEDTCHVVADIQCRKFKGNLAEASAEASASRSCSGGGYFFIFYFLI